MCFLQWNCPKRGDLVKISTNNHVVHSMQSCVHAGLKHVLFGLQLTSFLAPKHCCWPLTSILKIWPGDWCGRHRKSISFKGIPTKLLHELTACIHIEAFVPGTRRTTLIEYTSGHIPMLLRHFRTTGVPHLQENATAKDPNVGLCLGS